MRSVCLTIMLVCPVVACVAGPSLGLEQDLMSSEKRPGYFPLVSDAEAAPLIFDAEDYPGVIRAVRDLQSDVARVTTCTPSMSPSLTPSSSRIVIVGTLGKNAVLDQLVSAGKLDCSDLTGKWESFVITTVDKPLPGVNQALVIAGSDKRGTIYGVYELSEQIGVSPWFWWADVPPRRRPEVFVVPGRYASGEPAVRYRGIFINDEAPCLTGWAAEKFGGLNSKFYTRVFELILRMRGNYLWPAMWDNAFNEDDPENPRLADEYGIVMGTSHHEPMMRAHKEWTSRRQNYGNGKWNYATNGEALRKFFREGIARNKHFENLVTIGMRGDGDTGMASTGSIESDMRLLQQIFDDQREILADEMQTDPARVPQLWALFTEVQKYYEHGLRPPDDVTLLWTDDNTGNLRRLPTAEERKRSGGAGIYYHIDMHGGPYAYQWINTNPLPKIAEQMNLAYEYGATRIWIVNVGDIKPLEVPLEFFLRFAWNPSAWPKERIGEYLHRWARREFGEEHAAEIAEIVARYAKLNGWRKPELVTPDTFSQLHHHEAARVEEAWRDVVERAESLYSRIPAEQRDAFYQLVLHPAKASSLVVRMNILAGRNLVFAKQGRASTNAVAARVRQMFREDQEMSEFYNRQLAGGKWNHLMDQAHLGQFTWEPPVVNVMPAVSEVLPQDESRIAVAVEGEASSWPDHFGGAALPVFESLNPRRSYVDVFAVGSRSPEWLIQAEQDWIRLTPEVLPDGDRRHWVEIDWPRLPSGESTGWIIVRGNERPVRIKVPVVKATDEEIDLARGRYASLVGAVSIAGNGATGRSVVNGVRWELIPDYGRGDGAMGIYPVTARSVLPPEPSPTLEYAVYLPRSGTYTVTLVLGPVMDFVPDRGMRIAVGFDEQPPQVLDIFADRAAQTYLSEAWWMQFTRDNARFLKSTHELTSKGPHVLKVAMVDPGVVVQKIIITDKAVPESYFGPPEMVLTE